MYGFGSMLENVPMELEEGQLGFSDCQLEGVLPHQYTK